MFDKWRKYSYAAQKNQRHRLRWILVWFLAFFLIYNVLGSLFFSMRVLENDTMQPGLRAGERFIFSSFAVPSFLAGISVQNRSFPCKRGNIVLVDMAREKNRNFLLRLLDEGIRFFTAQRMSLDGGEEHLYIKRVIGFPGDEITMTNFVLRVKPRGSSYSLTEFELSEKPYDVNSPQVPALWDESIPFSGHMDRIVLGDDECFVLSDDRSNTNDSRTWGPVPLSLIGGKALFRYWPFTRLGRP
jgi:signal peptidase I